MGESVHAVVPRDLQDLFLKAITPNVVFPDDAFYWAQKFFVELSAFDKEGLDIIREAGKAFYEQSLEALKVCGNDFHKVGEQLKAKLNVKGKSLFMPLRVALTNESHGPELHYIFELLGVKRIEQRLKMALEIVR